MLEPPRKIREPVYRRVLRPEWFVLMAAAGVVGALGLRIGYQPSHHTAAFVWIYRTDGSGGLVRDRAEAMLRATEINGEKYTRSDANWLEVFVFSEPQGFPPRAIEFVLVPPVVTIGAVLIPRDAPNGGQRPDLFDRVSTQTHYRFPNPPPALPQRWLDAAEPDVPTMVAIVSRHPGTPRLLRNEERVRRALIDGMKGQGRRWVMNWVALAVDVAIVCLWTMAGLGVLWSRWSGRAWARLALDLCPECGYPLEGVAGRVCPECGTERVD